MDRFYFIVPTLLTALLLGCEGKKQEKAPVVKETPETHNESLHTETHAERHTRRHAKRHAKRAS